MKPKIGFIGIGIMGYHMSRNLVEAGYSIVAYDINEPAVNRLVELGAQKGQSGQQVAALSELVITMLPDSPDVEKAALGPGGPRSPAVRSRARGFVGHRNTVRPAAGHAGDGRQLEPRPE